jgi:hypothetical protein
MDATSGSVASHRGTRPGELMVALFVAVILLVVAARTVTGGITPG